MATQILSGRERFIAPDPVATANPSFSENLLTLCASAIFAGLSPRELMEILSCARAYGVVPRDDRAAGGVPSPAVEV